VNAALGGEKPFASLPDSVTGGWKPWPAGRYAARITELPLSQVASTLPARSAISAGEPLAVGSDPMSSAPLITPLARFLYLIAGPAPASPPW
jgi:hypothetical protein